ncbi:MAG: tRNA glutamyl-Q synthetase [Panacagrimonas sp.]|jgi:glutamyl-Q tRNA(Asp) synthetase|nr:tRNA glutamyl-Q(34) synthetase GluQRS [Panacagrimonas sp.]MCC2657237.1 tRNA glutamyl-Q synthetase [Panacagrimonas sp.]
MSPYVGRFAPTPSGSLHLGSLVTALGSWLDARAAAGRWALRIDDLDRPRVRSGAEGEIVRQLEAHGLWWDGPIRRQSEHIAEYRETLERLRAMGCVYACRCTRAELARLSTPADANDETEAPYPGTCSTADWPDVDAALRVRIDPPGIDDVGGDFIVRRRDEQIGYQLACAVDEHAMGITDVVRGADLVQSGRRQRWLLGRLGLATPRYRHLPLVLAPDGRKLSKSTESQPIRSDQAPANLRLALRLLGQEGAIDVGGSDVRPLLQAATARWAPERIPTGPVRMT